MNRADASMLARYKAWANRAMFDAVAALPEGDEIWRAHLERRPHGYTARNTPDHPSLSLLKDRQAALDDWYIAYFQGLAEPALDERLDIDLIGGNRAAMTRGEILLHVVNHTSYHRGFVAEMFYKVPAKPPLTDLPVYLREAR